MKQFHSVCVSFVKGKLGASLMYNVKIDYKKYPTVAIRIFLMFNF